MEIARIDVDKVSICEEMPNDSLSASFVRFGYAAESIFSPLTVWSSTQN